MFCDYVNRLIGEADKLEQSVSQFLTDLDKLMAAPASYDRGAKMAELTNALFSAGILFHLESEGWKRMCKVKDIIENNSVKMECPMARIQYGKQKGLK